MKDKIGGGLKKIIYISTMPYSDKVMRDWHVEKLAENNYDVEFWDISKMSSDSASEIKENTLNGVKILENLTYRQLSKLLYKNQKSNIIYVIVASFHVATSKLYMILNKYKIFTVFFNWGDTPEQLAVRKKSFYQKILLLFNNQLAFGNSIKNILGIIYCKIIKKLKLIKIHDISFNVGITSSSLVNAKRTVQINLCDYDQYLIKTKLNLKPLNQAVFLDNNLTAHPDISLNDLKKANPEKYFNALSRYFDLFEEKYQTEVVISAHPTSNYINNEYKDRKVTRLQTAELVLKSKYVLAHFSTSISYAVLDYKPINLLVVDEWVGEFWEYASIEFSKSLGCNLINIDKISSVDEISFNRVEKNLYDDYKYNYIVGNKTEGLSSSSIILNEFNKYFKGSNING